MRTTARAALWIAGLAGCSDAVEEYPAPRRIWVGSKPRVPFPELSDYEEPDVRTSPGAAASPTFVKNCGAEQVDPDTFEVYFRRALYGGCASGYVFSKRRVYTATGRTVKDSGGTWTEYHLMADATK